MGNDGGSIPTRRELVKSPTRRATHSQIRDFTAQTQTYRWTTCPLSKRPLVSPVVSDSVGRLYNKDSILEWLLRKTEAFGDGEEVLEGRIKSLKDVVEVKFEKLENGDEGEAIRSEKWVCPVSRKELGPGAKAVYLVPCGHAFTDSAVKEVGSSESGCLMCNEPYEESNVIAINPTEPKDIERLQQRIASLAVAGLTHSLKKSSLDKKSKKRKNGVSEHSDEKRKKSKESGIKNASTASLTAKVMDDQNSKNKLRKLEMSDNVKSLFSDRDNAPGKNTDFMSRGYSIPARR